MASSTINRWLRPEVYPLFAAVGVAVGICGMQLVRNIFMNPEVRVTKENRAAGVLDNFEEGKKYTEHGLRKIVEGYTDSDYARDKDKRRSLYVYLFSGFHNPMSWKCNLQSIMVLSTIEVEFTACTKAIKESP